MEPLQVIAAPRRLRILELVWDRELSAGDIAAEFDVSWSAVSQHLRVLKAAGFVVERREGTSRLYRADQDTSNSAAMSPADSSRSQTSSRIRSRRGAAITCSGSMAALLLGHYAGARDVSRRSS